MFHVRAAGETFGNACAEFSHLGRPVVTTFSGACAQRTILGLSNAPNYFVVSDAEEFDIALNDIKSTRNLNAAQTGKSEQSAEPVLTPAYFNPSPYAVFSPSRVTRRLLELCDLALASKQAMNQHAQRNGSALMVSFLSPRQGQLIDTSYSTLVNIDIDLSAGPSALGLMEKSPASTWQVCVSAEAASELLQTSSAPLSASGGFCQFVVSDGSSLPPLQLKGILHEARSRLEHEASSKSSPSPMRLTPVKFSAQVATPSLEEIGSWVVRGEVHTEASVVVLCSV